MYCTQCGNPRADNAIVCANCGERVRRYPAPKPVPNYLLQSVLVTFCCCMPLGIVAIIFAAQVNSKLAMGDVPGAAASSKNAKLFSTIGFVCGLVAAILYAIGAIVSISSVK